MFEKSLLKETEKRKQISSRNRKNQNGESGKYR